MRLLLFSDLHLDTAFGWAGPTHGDRPARPGTSGRPRTLGRTNKLSGFGSSSV